jgi:hypothetical protein
MQDLWGLTRRRLLNQNRTRLMKVCLFVAVALLTLASSEAARGVTIPINLGPPGTLATDRTISFSDLNGTGLVGQNLSLDFVFTSSEFVRLFTVTTDFSVLMTLQTSSSIPLGVFLHGTGYLTDSLGHALEPSETLGSASSSNGSMSVALCDYSECGHTLFEWERPDCEAITNGGYPPEKCLCGQSHIIRNLSAEEAEIDRL